MIYFMQAEDGGPVKVGTSKNPYRRAVTFRSSLRKPIVILGTLPGGRAEEQELHRQFDPDAIGSEFFLPSEELLRFVGEHATLWRGTRDFRVDWGGRLRFDSPRCPDCEERLFAVRLDPRSTANAEEFNQQRAGAWFCDNHEIPGGDTVYFYFDADLSPVELAEAS